MITIKKTKIYGYSGIICFFCMISINAGIASHSENLGTESSNIDPDKITTTKDPDKKPIKTDSLAQYNKEVYYKNDSTHQKTGNPSSMSSMSYNILFQVIYRFSFSEIFDSPTKSEIITD